MLNNIRWAAVDDCATGYCVYMDHDMLLYSDPAQPVWARHVMDAFEAESKTSSACVVTHSAPGSFSDQVFLWDAACLRRNRPLDLRALHGCDASACFLDTFESYMRTILIESSSGPGMLVLPQDSQHEWYSRGLWDNCASVRCEAKNQADETCQRSACTSCSRCVESSLQPIRTHFAAIHPPKPDAMPLFDDIVRNAGALREGNGAAKRSAAAGAASHCMVPALVALHDMVGCGVIANHVPEGVTAVDLPAWEHNFRGWTQLFHAGSGLFRRTFGRRCAAST